MTITEVIKSGGNNPISALNAGTGNTELGKAVFEAALISLNDFYDIRWTDEQYDDCVEIMHSEYHWMSMAELKHFMTRAKSGSYGKIFGKFSPATLMDWLREYAEESLQQRAGLFARPEQKENPDAVYVPQEQVSKALLSFADQWQKELDATTEESEAEFQKRREEIVRRARDRFENKT